MVVLEGMRVFGDITIISIWSYSEVWKEGRRQKRGSKNVNEESAQRCSSLKTVGVGWVVGKERKESSRPFIISAMSHARVVQVWCNLDFQRPNTPALRSTITRSVEGMWFCSVTQYIIGN